MTDRFPDHVVMVTGASGLIGSAIVARFLEEGANVVAVDRENQIAKGGAYSGIPAETFESDRLLFVERDLSRAEEIEAAFADAEAKFGMVDTLVNNAAVYGRRAFEDMTEDHLERVFRINVFAVILATRRAVRAMREHELPGSIVNITSTSSQQSDPDSVHYDASKGAVDAATRAMAVSVGRYGIRVNAVGPGEMIKSQETDNLREPTDLSEFERRRIPIGRVATPHEVADAVLFLASDDARGISGSIVWVDGGTLGTWTTPAG